MPAEKGGGRAVPGVATIVTKRTKSVDGSRLRPLLVSGLLHLAVAAQLSYLAGELRQPSFPASTIAVELVSPELPEVSRPAVQAKPQAPRPHLTPAARPPARPTTVAVRQPLPFPVPAVSKTTPEASRPEAAPPESASSPEQKVAKPQEAVSKRPVSQAGEGGEPSGTGQVVPPQVVHRGDAPGPKKDDRAAARHSYLQASRLLIERHKEYPLMARKGRVEGTVLVAAMLARDGALLRCQVLKSSGSVLLDNAALRSVRAVAKFPPLPEALDADSLDFSVPVAFRLSGR